MGGDVPETWKPGPPNSGVESRRDQGLPARTPCGTFHVCLPGIRPHRTLLTLITLLLAAILAGSLVYCVFVVVASASYLGSGSARHTAVPQQEPVSVLKPLAGAEDNLESNLRTFFEQRHPEFEILFAVREADDPAVAVVERLRAAHPEVRSQLLVTGEPPYPNAKVFSLERMLAKARYDLLVMSDSDICVTPDFLVSVAAEFSDPSIGVATCPYRARSGRSLWSTLEAEGMNTEFLGGVLVAAWIEGVKFAVGPTLAARKSALNAIGGLAALKNYLAEDYQLGHAAAGAGLGVILSRTIVEHHIGSESFRTNALHRLRWTRSTRRSRPAGYAGMIFTNPLPIALALLAADVQWWPALAAALAFRCAAAWATSVWVLNVQPRWLLLPVQDALSFVFWVAGFFGNTIVWRGRRYHLYRDGRLELRA